jgi:hypothetical protein
MNATSRVGIETRQFFFATFAVSGRSRFLPAAESYVNMQFVVADGSV